MNFFTVPSRIFIGAFDMEVNNYSGLLNMSMAIIAIVQSIPLDLQTYLGVVLCPGKFRHPFS